MTRVLPVPSKLVRQFLTIFGLILYSFTLTLSLISAHAGYDHSDPPADAVIPAVPSEVHVWFTQELFRREGANDVEVFGPDGTQVDNDDARIDDDDRSHMLVTLPDDLPPGAYTVLWRSLSADDGDADSGRFVFTVDPSAEPTTPTPVSLPTNTTITQSQTPPTTTAQNEGSGLPCLGGMIVSGLLIIGLWQKRDR